MPAKELLGPLHAPQPPSEPRPQVCTRSERHNPVEHVEGHGQPLARQIEGGLQPGVHVPDAVYTL